MFAGLSGLSLAAFILVSELLSARGDKYLDICLVVVAIIWMTMNIGLSIWFFIQSLNVLDNRRRDRIMLKYFVSKVVTQYIKKLCNRQITLCLIHIRKHENRSLKNTEFLK